MQYAYGRTASCTGSRTHMALAGPGAGRDRPAKIGPLSPGLLGGAQPLHRVSLVSLLACTAQHGRVCSPASHADILSPILPAFPPQTPPQAHPSAPCSSAEALRSLSESQALLPA